VAEQLDFEKAVLLDLDKETFTDIPDGSLRQPDLMVEVRTKEGHPEIVLVHFEVQAGREAGMPQRMAEYYWLLRLRHRKPVFPVVVYLALGAGGLTWERHTEGVFGNELLSFRYAVVGLRDLQAEEYQEKESSLAPALTALMKPGKMGTEAAGDARCEQGLD
jgi:hypothetical protein